MCEESAGGYEEGIGPRAKSLLICRAKGAELAGGSSMRVRGFQMRK
jgi:hypothetical protein